MNTWNYRVIKSLDPIEGDTFQIHEVYYDENGKIEMWTERPTELAEGSVESLKSTLKGMLDATRKPALQEASVDGKQLLVPVPFSASNREPSDLRNHDVHAPENSDHHHDEA